MKKILKDILIDWAEKTKDDIVDKIIKEGAVDTGQLRDSIDYEIKEKTDIYSVKFEMVEYGIFVDEGTKYIRPREFFNKIIEKNEKDLINEIEEDLGDFIEKELTKKR